MRIEFGRQPFHYLFVPTVLPFADGGYDIDEAALRRYLERLSANEFAARGVGIVINSEAGELVYLSRQEARRTVEIAVEACAGRVPVVAGVAALRPETMIEIAARCHGGRRRRAHAPTADGGGRCVGRLEHRALSRSLDRRRGRRRRGRGRAARHAPSHELHARVRAGVSGRRGVEDGGGDRERRRLEDDIQLAGLADGGRRAPSVQAPHRPARLRCSLLPRGDRFRHPRRRRCRRRSTTRSRRTWHTSRRSKARASTRRSRSGTAGSASCRSSCSPSRRASTSAPRSVPGSLATSRTR